MLSAVAVAAETVGLTRRELLEQAEYFLHGTTQATNALLTRTGARTALITTRGHEDSIFIGKVYAKVAGLVERDIVHASRLTMPEPIIPRSLVRGVTERVDRDGDVVVALDEDEVVGSGRGADRSRRCGDRRLAAVVVRQPQPRAAHPRADRDPHPDALLRPLARGVAGAWRVRADSDHGGERVRRAADQRLSLQPGRDAPCRGAIEAAAGDGRQRRPHIGRGRRPAVDRDARLGPHGRGARLPLPRAARGRAQHHLHRRRRHLLRRRPDPRR